MLISSNMRISKLDKDILMLLQQHKEGLSPKQIAVTLKKELSNILVKLNRLERCLVVDRIEGYPKIYKIKKDRKITNQDFIFAKCPKCKKEVLVYGEQITKVCPECKHRFIIFNTERIDNKIIDKIKEIGINKNKSINEVLKEMIELYN